MTRGKFKCVAATKHAGYSAVTYKFFAVCNDGTPENERFHKYTPSGTLEISVDNPNVNFELGVDYYLDFTKA